MSELSEKVLAESVKYLGPAARVFLDRQTRMHMQALSFETLERKHLPELSKWVGISAALVIDKAKAAELAAKIGKL